ncbi:MAG: GNAT family N-acetyltransferase [Candidatus Sericytochromatia bacterium]
MKIEVLKTEDLNLVKELQPDGWYNILPTIEFYTKNNFCYPIKILLGDKLVGIGTTIIHHEVSWLAHIIVHRDYRNRGFGKLITEKLIDIAKEHNYETICLIATDMGEPVYKKIGFEEETEYLFFKDIKLSNHDKDKNIFAFTENLKEELFLLDKKVSGENRDFHLEKYLHTAFVYKKNDMLKGFYLPDFGEGLIIAEDKKAGLELMKFRFKDKDIIAFPINNTFALDFMYKNNFKEFKRAKRMFLGKKRIVELEKIYSRVAGNLG